MFDNKIAIIMRDDLATWEKPNVIAFLISGIAGAKSDRRMLTCYKWSRLKPADQ